MRYYVLFACVLAVTGCAKSTPIPDVKGKKAFFVECSGGAKSWSTCYEKANDVCAGSYKVVSKDQGHESTLHGVASGTTASVVGQSGTDRSMTITCN